MTDKTKVIRVNETPQQRVDRLRSEMHAVGEPPVTPAPAKTEQQLSDEALAKDRSDYERMDLDDVLDREIKLALSQPYDRLWPKDRHQLIKAGVGLIMARAKIPPQWGANLDAADEEETP